MKTEKIITISNNKKAFFDYNIEDKYICGIRIKGTEIKSIRNGNCSIKESYCLPIDNQIILRNMFVKKYEFGSYNNHEEIYDRTLLLTKQEIKKVSKKVSEKGYTIIPLRVLIVNGWVKIEIGIGKGKKQYDKKNTIRQREEEKRIKKDYNINI